MLENRVYFYFIKDSFNIYLYTDKKIGERS